MKVGTDGVLLGAWVSVRPSDRRILDIGTGTGLIALMMAQRVPGARITGVDVEDISQARENADASPWGGRVAFVQCPVQEFAPQGKFDLVVSNPPFFVDSLTCPDAGRTTARQAYGCLSAICATPSCVCSPMRGTSPWSCLRTRPPVSSASAGTCCFRCVVPTCARRPATQPNGCCSNSSVRLPATFFRPPPLRLPPVFPPRVPAFVPMTRRPLSDAVPLFSVPSVPAPDRTELVIGTGVHEQYTPEYRALTRDFYLKF